VCVVRRFTDEGDKLGIIFSTREESAAFARAIEPGLGYDIPVGYCAPANIFLFLFLFLFF
jgi:hypothetical protein